MGEFRFGGEKIPRPSDPSAQSDVEWARYVYDRKNVAGVQTEWWYHRGGCRQWFLAERNTLNNIVARTWLPERGGAAPG